MLGRGGVGGVMRVGVVSDCLTGRRERSLWRELGRIVLVRSGMTEGDEATAWDEMTVLGESLPWRVILTPPTRRKRVQKPNL